jgi:hypothetical protein
MMTKPSVAQIPEELGQLQVALLNVEALRFLSAAVRGVCV